MENKEKVVRGFKGFNKNLCCRGFQYEVGQVYETDKPISLCDWGFHFCRKFFDVSGYYSFDNNDNRFCEVEALGETIDGDDKSVTNKIRIVREISREEFMEIANMGKNNTGFWNTGARNTGDRNTGDRNTGDRNTGDWNTGDRNTGDWNTGDRNTGDWNTGDRNTGVFCTEEPKLIMFNKETDMSFEEWRNTRAYDLLRMIPKNRWVWFSDMTDAEKKKYPSAETCNGYLKEIPRKEASKEWWNNLGKFDKQEIFNLPNFDLKIFNEIMKLKITKKEYDEVMK